MLLVSDLSRLDERLILFLLLLFYVLVPVEFTALRTTGRSRLLFRHKIFPPFDGLVIITRFTLELIEPQVSRSDLTSLWSKPICIKSPLCSKAASNLSQVDRADQLQSCLQIFLFWRTDAWWTAWTRKWLDPASHCQAVPLSLVRWPGPGFRLRRIYNNHPVSEACRHPENK